MSLQTSSGTFSGLSHQDISASLNYYAPINPKLDAITAQIIKTQDSALEVMNLIEKGAFSQTLELQKTLPSVTWLGNLVDRIFGLGNYYLEKEKTTQVVAHAGQKRTFGQCPNLEENNKVIHHYIHTGYEWHIYPNNSCSPLNPVNYWTEMFQVISKPVSSDDVICRIAGCIKERFLACYPTCLPCVNASYDEKNDTLDTNDAVLVFDSDFNEHLTWIYLIRQPRSDRSNLNAWKLNQILTLFNTTRKGCENQVLHPKQADTNVYYSLLLIPVVLGGVASYLTYKRKKNIEEYVHLKQVSDSL